MLALCSLFNFLILDNSLLRRSGVISNAVKKGTEASVLIPVCLLSMQFTSNLLLLLY